MAQEVAPGVTYFAPGELSFGYQDSHVYCRCTVDLSMSMEELWNTSATTADILSSCTRPTNQPTYG